MQASAFKTLTPIVIVAAFVGLKVPAVGQDQPNVGVVRLSDGPASETFHPTGSMIGSPGGHWGHGDHGHHGTHRSAYPSPMSVWLSGHHNACTYSPDHNWSRPVKHPIRRAPVEYRRYWPDKWYGEPGSASRKAHYPTVAVPTDTTQLGYYYQRVPQWRPNPGMIPPRPWPSLWHRRECPGPMAQSPALGPSSPVPTPPGDEPASTPASPDADDLKKSASHWNGGARR